MFDIGSYPARTCAGVSRRSLLRVAASAPLAMGLSSARLLAEPKKARAKSVIFVFLWGAPSHLDTCDPKPDAPAEYRGPFGVIATRTPGVHFTELLPRLAQQSHRFNLIRTHTIQGTFSDSFYGGNANFIGWDLIGYPGARTVVSTNLQRMDRKPESSRKSAYDYGMFSKGEI